MNRKCASNLASATSTRWFTVRLTTSVSVQSERISRQADSICRGEGIGRTRRVRFLREIVLLIMASFPLGAREGSAAPMKILDRSDSPPAAGRVRLCVVRKCFPNSTSFLTHG